MAEDLKWKECTEEEFAAAPEDKKGVGIKSEDSDVEGQAKVYNCMRCGAANAMPNYYTWYRCWNCDQMHRCL